MNAAPEHNEDKSKLFQDVGKIIQALDKNIRSKKLYANNNPILRRHRDELLALLTVYVQAEGDLALAIEALEIKLGDRVVYAEPDRQENFAFKLFNDGIRSLTFQSGVGQEEIDRFLDALILSGKAVEDETGMDAAAALWEQEFEHIRYTIANAIVEEAPRPGEKSSEEKIGEILDPTMARYAGPGETSRDDEDEEAFYRTAKATITPVSAGKLFQSQTVLDAPDLARIRQDLADCDKPERLLLDFVDMVLAVLMEERDPESFFRFVDYLGQVLENTLMQSRLELTRLLLELVRRFGAKPIPMLAQNPALMQEILDRLWTEQRMQLFLLAADEAPEAALDDVETIVQRMGPGPLRRMVEQLDSIRDPGKRKLALRGAAKADGADLPGLATAFLGAKETEKLRLGLYLLSLSPDPKAIDALSRLVAHPSPQIKKEAMALLRRFPGAPAAKALRPALADPQEEIRLFALKTLSLVGDKATAKELGVTVMSPAFHERSIAERRAYYVAVAKLAGDDFLPYLEGIFDTKNWFKNTAVSDLYLCAASALLCIPTPKGKDLFEKARNSGNRSLQLALQAAVAASKAVSP